MDDVITLISQTREQDDNGIWRAVESQRREVFCRVFGITRAEFFAAGRNGLNPEYLFQVFHADYGGESLVEYRGETYSVYRTYRPGAVSGLTDSMRSSTELGLDYIELYVQRKGGSNGEVESSADRPDAIGDPGGP